MVGIKLAFCALALACALFASAQNAPANDDNPGSLWSQNATDPLHDRTAYKEGDIITVIITESTSASFAAQTQTAKADSAGINQGIGPILRIIPHLGVGASSSTAGSGSTTQTGTFTGTITAIVKKVLPNGNMLIEGHRDIVYNKDTQTLKLTGIIRREDISPTNTILSTQIANAEIRAVGKGQITDRQRRGLLMRLLDWLF